ncbi:hypothetical protein MSKU9_0829 [Komagataeibacter diospyri]|uniref:AlpA family phage regulatory protein n=3 Tax=Acetobacteraceae TaxID=433 RepID=A0A4P5NM28_9PROT|nr:hypothetical protein MSKU9_0829 [Komagataeibacter diospyri]
MNVVKLQNRDRGLRESSWRDEKGERGTPVPVREFVMTIREPGSGHHFSDRYRTGFREGAVVCADCRLQVFLSGFPMACLIGCSRTTSCRLNQFRSVTATEAVGNTSGRPGNRPAPPLIPGDHADIRNSKNIDLNRQDMEDLNMDATEYRPDSRLLRLREVTERTGLSRATIYRHISKGTFPRPRKLSSGTIRWHSGIIEDWINTAGTSDT